MASVGFTLCLSLLSLAKGQKIYDGFLAYGEVDKAGYKTEIKVIGDRISGPQDDPLMKYEFVLQNYNVSIKGPQKFTVKWPYAILTKDRKEKPLLKLVDFEQPTHSGIQCSMGRCIPNPFEKTGDINRETVVEYLRNELEKSSKLEFHDILMFKRNPESYAKESEEYWQTTNASLHLSCNRFGVLCCDVLCVISKLDINYKATAYFTAQLERSTFVETMTNFKEIIVETYGELSVPTHPDFRPTTQRNQRDAENTERKNLLRQQSAAKAFMPDVEKGFVLLGKPYPAFN